MIKSRFYLMTDYYFRTGVPALFFGGVATAEAALPTTIYKNVNYKTMQR
jgi:hypothetical protein